MSCKVKIKVKVKVKVTYKKVKITFLPIALVLFVVDTSNLSHIVAYKKDNQFLPSKVKVKVKVT